MARYPYSLLLIAVLSIIIFSCQHSSQQPSAEQKADQTVALADSVSAGYSGDGTSGMGVIDSGSRFIRTAELRFRVLDVARSTYSIEDAVRDLGGYVESTRLGTVKERVEETPVSRDSLLETTYFTVSNNIRIRVPNRNLDSALTRIAREVDFLDSRQVEAEDVSLPYLANQIQSDIQKHSSARLARAIDQRQARLSDVEGAENSRETKESGAADRKIDNLRLDNQVSMSTIRIDLYQRESVQRVLMAHYTPVKPYQPGFWTRIGESFQFGWDMIRDILIFIVKIWGLIFLLALSYLLYRLVRARKPLGGPGRVQSV